MGVRWGRGWFAGLAAVAMTAAGAGFVAPPSQASSVAPRAITATVMAWRHSAPAELTIGRSARGRILVARRQGSAQAPVVIFVLGQMHGDEPRGIDVVREVRSLSFPMDVQVWSMSTMNPDGLIAGTRVNAHRVDLNRNFPFHWRANPGSKTYFPGTRPVSEPETRAVIEFLDHLRPDVVLSFHQAFRAIDAGPMKAQPWVQLMSQSTGLPIKDVPCHGPCSGTMTSWYNDGYLGAAVTVELPRHVNRHQAQIYARAVYQVSLALLTCRAKQSADPSPSVSTSPATSPSVSPSPSMSPSVSTSPSPDPTPSVTSVPTSGVSSPSCP